ncbi:uncharacterized protein LOC105202589 isoform X2 [Solenopsis invicta]|uniref:uncharacterized protein LOC105202589 isoform X2 n=1 Tax=Solenopsis invicta TaxID=13686 RepID=UPI000E33F569|nr:uncharacterized protein LOC105202589 isoform X2 [Solenopsis invicta]
MNTDVVDLSINISQTHRFILITEYFIDQEKYFYLILLHINLAICIGILGALATGTLFIMYFHHTCGMFKIASYRIEYAMNINVLQNFTLKNEILMTESIICAVKIHRKAMKLSQHMLSKFKIMVSCITLCGVACLSFNLFQMASFQNNVNEILLPFVFSTICMLYMFLANFMAQKISDHNNYVLTTAYNVQWYKTPLYIQKMILFLLQRGTREFTLNIGGLIHGSMECFASLVKTSVSYFTIIYSTR